jgi:hypothetical protein
MSWINEEYQKLDRSPRALRRFGFTVGLVLLLLGGLMAWRHRNGGWVLVSIGTLLALTGAFVPAALRYVYQIWMTFAFALGWVMTRMILTIVFCLIVTPIGLLQRLCGKRPLEYRFKSDESTYWQRRTAGPGDYEKQF